MGPTAFPQRWTFLIEGLPPKGSSSPFVMPWVMPSGRTMCKVALTNLKAQDGCTEYRFKYSFQLIPSVPGCSSKLLTTVATDFLFKEGESDGEESEQSLVSWKFLK